MWTSNLKLTSVAAAALVALMSTFSSAAFADKPRNAEGMKHQGGMQRNAANMDGNRAKGMENRNFSKKGDHNDVSRRHAGRRDFRGRGFGGVNVVIGGGSSCRSAYRKWQNTGSRYWRERYYDCVS